MVGFDLTLCSTRASLTAEERCQGGRMTEEGWLETDSETFATLGEVFVPGREEILRAILDHVPAAPDETFLAVDICYGGGWLSEAVLSFAFKK